MSNSDNQVLGVVVLVRHGDRQGFYQDPQSYQPSDTSITALGTQQEYQLGQLLRRRYLNSTSPSVIEGISPNIVDDSQFYVRADAGGEGGVIFNSASALLQGLFPANEASGATLANGTTIVAPLGGYQYIPIESVEPDNDISLEGWTSCGTFSGATKALYASPEFKAKEQEHAAFFQELSQYVDGRPVSLENMWNIYDYMKVQSIHDAEYASRLPPTILAQAQDLANYHEYHVFSSPQLGGIGNIAGRTLLPSILEGFSDITNPSKSLKFVYEAISYKPFISLFNMTGVSQTYPELAGVVNFAAAAVLELRSSIDGPVIRFGFKNGTSDSDFRSFNLLGASGDVPLSQFIQHLAPTTINDTASWCTECSNSQDRGCAGLVLTGEQPTITGSHHTVRPIGAGFLGAGITLTFSLVLFLLAMHFGIIKIGRQNKKTRAPSISSIESDLEKDGRN